MAKLSISQRDRYALFIHLNPQPVQNRAEARRLDHLWSALELDPIAAQCEPRPTAPRLTEFDDVRAEIELSSDERDTLIGFLERPMSAGQSRTLLPILDGLIKGRDGEGA